MKAEQKIWFSETLKDLNKPKKKKEVEKPEGIRLPDNSGDIDKFCFDLVELNPGVSFRELVKVVPGVSHHNTLKFKAEKYALDNGLELNRNI